MNSTILKNTSIQTVSVFIQAVLQIVYIAVLSRLISPHDFGLAAISIATISLAKMFSEAGIGSSIVQKLNIDRSFVSTAFFIAIVLYLFSGLVIYIIAPIVSKYNHAPELEKIIKFLIVPFVLLGLSSLPMGLLLRHREYKKMLFVEVGSYFFGVIVIAIVLAFLGLGIWAILWGQFVYSSLNFILSVYFSRIKIDIMSVKKENLKSIIHFGGGITLSRIFNYFTLEGDKFILGNLLSVTILGWFDRIYKIVLILSSQMGNIIDKIYFPIFSQLQNNDKELGVKYTELIVIVLQIGLFILSTLPFFSKEIIFVLLGVKWLHLNSILAILFFLPIFGMTSRVGDIVLRSKAKVYQSAIIKLFSGIITLSFLYFGANYNLIGIAIAYILATMLKSLILNIYIIIGLKINLYNIIKSFFFVSGLPILSILVFVFSNYYIYFSNLLVSLVYKLFVLIVCFGGVYYIYPKLLGENLLKIMKRKGING